MKLGMEAHAAVKDVRSGTTYRKNGRPFINVMTKEEAIKIQRFARKRLLSG